MPSGKTHDKITLCSTLLVGTMGYYITNDIQTTVILSTSYCLSGLMFSGDLDIHSVQVKRWGVFDFIWKPYQKMFSHRSKWTHDSILGTITRLIYLFLWVLLGVWILNIIFPDTTITTNSIIIRTFEWIKNNSALSICIFTGMVLGAFSHTFADKLYSNILRKKRRKHKRK